MSWYVASTVNGADEYINPGSYTISIPNNASIINFEIIGAGGAVSASGSGGYMKGSINVSTFQGQNIIIVVGASDTNSSGASYIYKSSGPLFVMSGAGGGGSGVGGTQYGGWGGGGTFINTSDGNFIAIGGDGEGGSGNGGQGGQTSGGGVSGSCGNPPDAPGSGRPIPEDYQQASGGSSAYTVAGGSGYTGGGGGCAGGGGSSYYNSSYTSITLSYAGNSIPSNILVGYGREYQHGYISIEYL